MGERNPLAIYDQPLVSALAQGAGLDPVAYLTTICRTVIRGKVTNEQIMAGLTVAKEYGLNPITREMYFFPDRDGGIQPVVAVDGWIKKMEDHPQRDGESFTFGEDEDGAYCEGTFYRKDRSHPTVIREYMNECKRNTPTWSKMPKRMLRNRVICQGARITYNLMPGVMEKDEAEAWYEARSAVVGDRKNPTAGTEALKKAVGAPVTDAAAADPHSVDFDDVEYEADEEAGPRTCPTCLVALDKDEVCPRCYGGE